MRLFSSGDLSDYVLKLCTLRIKSEEVWVFRVMEFGRNAHGEEDFSKAIDQHRDKTQVSIFYDRQEIWSLYWSKQSVGSQARNCYLDKVKSSRGWDQRSEVRGQRSEVRG